MFVHGRVMNQDSQLQRRSAAWDDLEIHAQAHGKPSAWVYRTDLPSI